MLIRHAKSSWKNSEYKDIERPLSKRGKKASKLLGKVLFEKELIPQKIFSSPAARALNTAKRLVKGMPYKKKDIVVSDLLYPGNRVEMLQFVQALNDKDDFIFIIGHDPGLLDLGNYLSGSTIEKIPTSGYMLIEFNEDKWKSVKKNSGALLLLSRV